MRVLAFLVAILAVVVACAGDQGYELKFWPGSGVELDGRTVRVEPHPCGSAAIARVSRVPPLVPVGPLIPDRIVEVSLTGEVMRRWAVPIDSIPVELVGDRVLVTDGDRNYWIGIDGSLEIGPTKSPGPPEHASCNGDLRPEFGQTLHDPPFTQCQTLRDSASGKPRTLAFEGVCS